MPLPVQPIGGLNRLPVWALLCLQVWDRWHRQGQPRRDLAAPQVEHLELVLERGRREECAANLRDLTEVVTRGREDAEEPKDATLVEAVVGAALSSDISGLVAACLGHACRRRHHGVVEGAAARRARPGLVRW